MLAQAAGSYRERPVEGVLQDHFACVWVHQLPRPDVQPVVVVPDGCIDLEWIDGALRIAGPDRAPKIERLAAGATVVGFRFRPRRPPRGWDCRRPKPSTAASRWRRSGVPMRAAWPHKRARRGHRRARAGDRERTGAARAIDFGASAGHARGVRAARDRRAARQVADPMARRGARAERADPAPALRRGIRIRPMLRFLKLLRGTRNGSTADLAMEAGYADQAHLGRESRRLAVTTPQRIAALLAGRPAH